MNKSYAVKILAAVFLVMSPVLLVMADVRPPSVTATLNPGEYLEIEKEVDVPEVPPKIDVFLLENETGSFCDDIANLQTLAPQIFDQLIAKAPNSWFGVGGFRDFPFTPWGDPGDWAYRLVQDMTPTKATFVAGVNNLTCGGGYDYEESQYEALYQAATGAGKTAYGYTIPAGENPSFRSDAFKVIILATDADFHDTLDPGNPGPYPGPSRNTAVNALLAAGITVIGLTPISLPQLDDVASATGGVVMSTSASGDDVADAIMDALGLLTYDITAQSHGLDPPLNVSFTPPVHADVAGPTIVTFMERIEVPMGTSPGTYSGTASFKANGGIIAEQSIRITVPGVIPMLLPWGLLILVLLIVGAGILIMLRRKKVTVS